MNVLLYDTVLDVPDEVLAVRLQSIRIPTNDDPGWRPLTLAEARPLLTGQIQKHGVNTHPEETHGNWATGTITDQGKERGRESIPSPKTALPPPPSPEVNAYQLLDYNAQRLAEEFRPGIDDNPEIVALAAERFQVALAQEQAITPILTQVAAQTGGEFQHFDQRVKYESSIREKIPRIQREHVEAEKPVPSNAEAAAQISDLNRYTLMFPSDSYGQGVKATVATLESQGWTVLKAKNAWPPGDYYDGINAKFTNGDAVFEMQFHTPESAKIKDVSHQLYQQARLTSTPPERVVELKQQIFELWNADRSFVPPGAETVFGTQFSYVGKAKEIAVSYYVKIDDTGQVFAFYRVRPDGLAEVLRPDGTWGESTAVTVLDLAGLGGEIYQQATADQAAKWARGDTPEVLEANRQLRGAIDEVEKHATHDQSTHGNWADGLPEVEAKHEAPYGSPKPSVWDSKTLSFDSGDAGDLREAKRKWFVDQSSKEVWNEIDTALDHSADSHFFDRGPFAEAVGHVYSGKSPQTDLQKGVALQRSWTQKVWERIYGDATEIPVYRVEGGPQARKSTGLVSFSVPENRSQLKAMARNTGGKLVQDTVTKDEAVLLFWGEGRFRSNYVSVKGEVLAWRPEKIGKHYGPGPHASGSSQDVHGGVDEERFTYPDDVVDLFVQDFPEDEALRRRIKSASRKELRRRFPSGSVDLYRAGTIRPGQIQSYSLDPGIARFHGRTGVDPVRPLTVTTVPIDRVLFYGNIYPAIREGFGISEEEVVIRSGEGESRLEKHADHDQSTHGNWSSGLSARQIATSIDEPDEGFTRHYPTGTEPTTGFAVALPGHEAKIEIERVTEGWVRQYRKQHAEALGRDDTNWGGWVEPNDQGGFDAYMDVSVVTDTYDEAAAIGGESGQKAIYDIENGETLYLEAS